MAKSLALSPTHSISQWPGLTRPSIRTRRNWMAASKSGHGERLLVVKKAPQLPECLGFDLPDGFARHRELLADLFQRVAGADAEQHAATHIQNAFGKPAWRRMALAVWRLGMPIGTAKFCLVIGLCQISWLLLPCRTRLQPADHSNSRNARSNCGAIQTAAGSASRSAVICRNKVEGSISG